MLSLREQITACSKQISICREFPNSSWHISSLYEYKRKRNILVRCYRISEHKNAWKVENYGGEGFALIYINYKLVYKQLPNTRPAERDDKYELNLYFHSNLVKSVGNKRPNLPMEPKEFVPFIQFVEL